METIEEDPEAPERMLLQCDIPVSLMRRLRIEAGRRNIRGVRQVVVDALEAFVPKDDEPDLEAKKRKRA